MLPVVTPPDSPRLGHTPTIGMTHPQEDLPTEQNSSTTNETSSSFSSVSPSTTDTLSVHDISSALAKVRLQNQFSISAGEENTWEVPPISGFTPDEREAPLKIALSYLKGDGVPVDEKKGLESLMELKEYAPAQYHIAECHEYGIGTIKDEAESVKWYYKSALQGYAAGQNSYAVALSCGIGVAVNKEKALPWYEAAVAQGYAWAQLNLGRHYKNKTKEYVKAVELFQKSAAQNNIQAHIALGDCYQEGIGVEKDAYIAFVWYSKAAQFHAEFNNEKDIPWHLKERLAGKARAQYEIYLCYQKGVGVETDLKEAVTWLEKSAALGHPAALNALGLRCENGNGVEKDLAKAVSYYRQAANKGNSWGEYNLAQCYQDGIVVQQDLKIAFELFEKSAKKGNAAAQNRLGVWYEKGIWVEVNFENALSYYQQAAEKGNAWGEYNLARFYQNGTVVSQDLKKAFDLFEKSANQGNAAALSDLGECYEYGEGVERDLVRAFECYKQSAEKNNSRGQYRLALCYLTGLGIKENNKEAVEWLWKSVKQGNTNAQYKLAHCLMNGMDGVPSDQKTATSLMAGAALGGHLEARETLGSCRPNNSKTPVEAMQKIWNKIYHGKALDSRAQEFFMSQLQGNFIITENSAGRNFNVQNVDTLKIVQRRNQYLNTLEEGNVEGLIEGISLLDAEQQKNIDAILTCLADMKNDPNLVCLPLDVQMQILNKVVANQHIQTGITDKLRSAAKYSESATLFEVNQAEATTYFEMAAESGDTSSQYELGLRFENGFHNSIDYNQAFKWYLQAGCNGHGPSMVRLEDFYRQGLGTNQDNLMADIWSNLHKNQILSVEDQSYFVHKLQSHPTIKSFLLSGLDFTHQRLIIELVQKNNNPTQKVTPFRSGST